MIQEYNAWLLRIPAIDPSFLSLLKRVEVQISEPLRVFNIIFK